SCSGSCRPGTWTRIRLAPWRTIVGSSVPSALMRRSMTSRALSIAELIAASSPAWVGRITIVAPSTFTSNARLPPNADGRAWSRAMFAASAARAGSRTTKESWPLLVETSPMSIRGEAVRIARRTLSSIISTRWRATSPVCASSSRWLPPARSRPRLTWFLCTQAGIRCAMSRGSRLGIDSMMPMASTPQMLAIFQRGKSSSDISVVRRVRAVRHDIAQHRLQHLDAHALSDLQLHLLLVHLGDLADQAAAGDGAIARLDRGDHLAVRLHLALLRPDHQQVEDDEDEDERKDLDQECRGAPGCGAARCRGKGWR